MNVKTVIGLLCLGLLVALVLLIFFTIEPPEETTPPEEEDEDEDDDFQIYCKDSWDYIIPNESQDVKWTFSGVDDLRFLLISFFVLITTALV